MYVFMQAQAGSIQQLMNLCMQAQAGLFDLQPPRVRNYFLHCYFLHSFIDSFFPSFIYSSLHFVIYVCIYSSVYLCIDLFIWHEQAGLLDLLLLRDCDYFIGQFSSAMSLMALELSAAQKGYIPPYIGLDGPWQSMVN